MTKTTKRIAAGALLVLLLLALGACRNETQNRIRRSIQDFTNVRMYITLYAYSGEVIFEGQVDGKVTRSGAEADDGSEAANGAYIYWYDERGRYHQSDLPYLLTIYDRADGEPAP